MSYPNASEIGSESRSIGQRILHVFASLAQVVKRLAASRMGGDGTDITYFGM
jgi:hypothetical protein